MTQQHEDNRILDFKLRLCQVEELMELNATRGINSYRCEMILNHLEAIKEIADTMSNEIVKEMREHVVTMEGLT